MVLDMILIMHFLSNLFSLVETLPYCALAFLIEFLALQDFVYQALLASS